MKCNLTLEEAQALLFTNCHVLPAETVGLMDSLGRILAEDCMARESIPPFARSPYDGYAFRAQDTEQATAENPVTLEIIEEIPAGYAPTQKVTAGKAVKILTGAPVPEGADAVTKYEDTRFDQNFVSVYTAHRPGENIVPAGEDVAQGDLIARKGSKITPPVLGLMAALGLVEVPVYRKPRVAIISTGDELVDVPVVLTPGKIRNSNSYSVWAYCRELGADPVIIGIAKDKKEEVGQKIKAALAEADMVITTGGVSVGDYDVVRDAVAWIGAETLFWKIEIKPGSASLLARMNDKIIMGLSGNPASALIVFQLLAAPGLKKMGGNSDYLPPATEVLLRRNFRKASPRRRFLRGKLILENGSVYMETTGDQGNGVLSSMVECNVLAEIPEGSGPVQAGTKLMAYRLD